MKVTRTSQVSGVTRTLDLDITQQQLINYEKGMKIQYAFPNLTASEREFFMTGITDEEWNVIAPDEDDYDNYDNDVHNDYEY